MYLPVPIGQQSRARVLRAQAGGSAAIHGSFDRGPGNHAVSHRRAGQAGMQQRWLVQVDSGGGDHLRRQLALAGGVREVRESAGADARWRTPTRPRRARSAVPSSAVPGRRRFRCMQAVWAAWGWGLPTFWSALIAALVGPFAADGVGEVRHPVGAHAAGVGKRPFWSPSPRGGGRGGAAATAGREQGDRGDGSDTSTGMSVRGRMRFGSFPSGAGKPGGVRGTAVGSVRHAGLRAGYRVISL